MTEDADDELEGDDVPEGEESSPDCQGQPPASNGAARKGSKGAGRTAANEALALALASGKTVSEAAKAAGVSESTAYRRLAEAAFAARVRDLRSQMISAAAGKLAAGMASAADVLRELLGSESEGIRMRAADHVLSQGLKVVELTELQQRVEQLEQLLGKGGAQ